jgi:hypothetical protein
MAYPPADHEQSDNAPALPTYSALILNTHNEVIRVEKLRAIGYGTAVAIARALADGRPVELWQGVHCIERLKPPIASGI